MGHDAFRRIQTILGMVEPALPSEEIAYFHQSHRIIGRWTACSKRKPEANDDDRPIRRIITRRSERSDRETLLGADGGNADSDMLGAASADCAAKPQVTYDRAIAKGLSATPRHS